jgi:hypothetical protein
MCIIFLGHYSIKDLPFGCEILLFNLNNNNDKKSNSTKSMHKLLPTTEAVIIMSRCSLIFFDRRLFLTSRGMDRRKDEGQTIVCPPISHAESQPFIINRNFERIFEQLRHKYCILLLFYCLLAPRYFLSSSSYYPHQQSSTIIDSFLFY